MNEESSFIPELTLDPNGQTAAAVQEAPEEKEEEAAVDGSSLLNLLMNMK